MTSRPEYVHCAQMDLWDGKDPPKPTNRTWCGRIVSRNMEWQFAHANHALLTGVSGSRLMLCAKCAAAMKEALRAVAYRPMRKKKPT